MNWDKKNLQSEEIEFLQSATSRIDLRDRVVRLREQGFTVRDIASVINVPPSTVQYWSRSARLPYPPPEPVVKSRAVELKESDATTLSVLAKQARRANRHTQSGTADHRASQEFTRLLRFLARERLIPIKTLAKASDVSASAVSQRIK